MWGIIFCGVVCLFYTIISNKVCHAVLSGEMNKDFALLCVVSWGFSCALACLIVICGSIINGGK